jgi:hypothetical protein
MGIGGIGKEKNTANQELAISWEPNKTMLNNGF